MDVKVLQKSISDRMSLQKKKNDSKCSSLRFLVTVNVLGSAGPIRFVASERDRVLEVIDAALKLYNREERLPQLGSDVHGFLLYPANAGLDALEPSEAIGSQGMRNFILCKKERQPQKTQDMAADQKRSNSWKAWLNKSLTFKISSH